MNVMVVDDNQEIGQALREQLEDAGHTVIGPIPRVAEALAAIAYYPLDVAILDINMGQEGYVTPVADALDDRGIPFVFLTGYSAYYARGMPLGRRFKERLLVTKPYQQAELFAALEAAVAAAPARPNPALPENGDTPMTEQGATPPD